MRCINLTPIYFTLWLIDIPAQARHNGHAHYLLKSTSQARCNHGLFIHRTTQYNGF